MRFRGGGVGHTSTRNATNRFLQDRDRLDRDNGLMQGGDDATADESDDGLDGDGIDSDGGDEGEGLEKPGTGNVDDEGRYGDEEEDYGLVDRDSDEDSDDNEPLDIADDALGPEDGEGDIDEVDLLGFASF